MVVEWQPINAIAKQRVPLFQFLDGKSEQSDYRYLFSHLHGQSSFQTFIWSVRCVNQQLQQLTATGTPSDIYCIRNNRMWGALWQLLTSGITWASMMRAELELLLLMLLLRWP